MSITGFVPGTPRLLEGGELEALSQHIMNGAGKLLFFHHGCRKRRAM